MIYLNAYVTRDHSRHGDASLADHLWAEVFSR